MSVGVLLFRKRYLLAISTEIPPKNTHTTENRNLHLSRWNRAMTLKYGHPVSSPARPWANVEVTVTTAEPIAPVFKFTVEIIEPSVGERRWLRSSGRTILRARGI